MIDNDDIADYMRREAEEAKQLWNDGVDYLVICQRLDEVEVLGGNIARFDYISPRNIEKLRGMFYVIHEATDGSGFIVTYEEPQLLPRPTMEDEEE